MGSKQQIVKAAPAVQIVSEALLDKIQSDIDAQLDPYIAPKLKMYEESRDKVAALKVTDQKSLEDADEWTKALLKERAGLEAVRESGPGAFNKLGRRIGAKFKPLFDALDTALANLKNERGAYIIAERNKQAAAYQVAAVAHMQGEHAQAQQALAVANEAVTLAPQGTSVRERWAVERYELPMMVLSTPEHPGLVPDEKAIAAYLATLAPDEEPALPGVICKKVPHVTDRRN